MSSDTQSLLRWFYRAEFPSGELAFDDILYGATQAALGKTTIEAEAYLERNIKRIWSELLKAMDADHEAGRLPAFDVVAREARRFRWRPSNLGFLTSRKDKVLGYLLAARPHINRVLDDFTDREYEALACMVCKFIGAANVLLTPPGNERGVDFFATIESPSKCHVFGRSHRLYRIVGQAKKYESKVELKEIQRLNETLNEVRLQSAEIQRLLPPWFQVATGPIIGWMIAHSGVQAGGISAARARGIIVSDSMDLTEILALSRRLDTYLNPKERAAVLKAKTKEYLAQQGEHSVTRS